MYHISPASPVLSAEITDMNSSVTLRNPESSSSRLSFPNLGCLKIGREDWSLLCRASSLSGRLLCVSITVGGQGQLMLGLTSGRSR